MQRAYELMVIIDGGLEDGVVQADIAKIQDAIVTEGGRVASADKWGKRRFAYEIDHKTEGTYVVFEIVTETAGLPEVERMLRLADDFVRHKLVRLPEKEATKRGLLAAATPA